MVWRLPFTAALLLFMSMAGFSQTCPTSGTTNLGTNPNSYYPGTGTVNAGATSITLGPIGIGSTPIAAGDLVLIIQMQGTQIAANNNNRYGDNTPAAPPSGYLNNANTLAGNMEYAVVSGVAGTVITLSAGTTRSYRNTNFGANGQYRFQVIRVPIYYNLTLTADINTPAWNGAVGGVTVLRAVNSINMAGFAINGSAAGFRGGGTRQLTGGTGANTSVRTLSTINNNSSKGEGIAGTPRYMFVGGAILDNTDEGYPNGSHARGAPGNAGGGGTDGVPASNSENSGGGGGGNGGAGGKGGNTWNTNLTIGGEGGVGFAQGAANRIVLGGGGGGGTSNNGTGTPGAGAASSGATGGGIVIFYTRFITGAGTINVNGQSANNTVANDGSGGGGAGGSVLLTALTGHANITVTARGGNGGSNTGGGATHGPGGGGGGGLVYSNGTLNAASSVVSGNAGTTAGGIVFGAGNGASGVLVQNASLASFPVNTDLCVLLPANMINFTLQEQNLGVRLTWTVATEINVKAYEVERSIDGTHFNTIGSVAFRPGNGVKQYNFDDPITTAAYYRIRTVDIDERYEYSRVLLYRGHNTPTSAFSVYPNPGQAYFQLLIPGAGNSNLSIRLVDMTGRWVLTKNDRASGGQYHLILPGNLKGVYMLQVENNGQLFQQKVVIQ